MDINNENNYNKIISERLIQILNYSNLEIKGIAALTDRSIDIFYAVLAQRRPLSQELAKAIGDALDFDGMIIFNINIQIPTSIKTSPSLLAFRKENISNHNYFTDSWSADKDSSFIKDKLVYSGYFSEPRYAWEVNDTLKNLGRKLDSDLLSKQLKYLVTKEIIKSKRAPIKLKNGGFGKRMVDVYYL